MLWDKSLYLTNIPILRGLFYIPSRAKESTNFIDNICCHLCMSFHLCTKNSRASFLLNTMNYSCQCTLQTNKSETIPRYIALEPFKNISQVIRNVSHTVFWNQMLPNTCRVWTIKEQVMCDSSSSWQRQQRSSTAVLQFLNLSLVFSLWKATNHKIKDHSGTCDYPI